MSGEILLRSAALLFTTLSGLFISRYAPISSLEDYYAFVPLSTFVFSGFMSPLSSQFMGKLSSIPHFEQYIRFSWKNIVLIVAFVCAPMLIFIEEVSLVFFIFLLVDVIFGTYSGILLTSLSMNSERIVAAKLALVMAVLISTLPTFFFFLFDWNLKIYIISILITKFLFFIIVLFREEASQSPRELVNIDLRKYVQGVCASLISWAGQHLPKLLILGASVGGSSAKIVTYIVAIQAGSYSLETIFRGYIEESYTDGQIVSKRTIRNFLLAFLLLIPGSLFIIYLYTSDREWQFSLPLYFTLIIFEMFRFITSYISLKYQIARLDFVVPIVLALVASVILILANLFIFSL